MPKDSQNICNELKSTVVCHAHKAQDPTEAMQGERILDNVKTTKKSP